MSEDGRAEEGMSFMKLAYLLVMGIAFTLLSGCVSSQREAEADTQACSAQGFAPGSGAFTNCVTAAGIRRDDATSRQFDSMRRLHERDMDNFLGSSAFAP
jgi:hypothetical protein